MPTNDTQLPPIHDQFQQDIPTPAQPKLCSSCQRPLSADSTTNPPFFIHDSVDPSDTTAIVCGPCHSHLLSLRAESPLFAEVERELIRRAASLQGGDNEARHSLPPILALIRARQPSTDTCPDEDMYTESINSVPVLTAPPNDIRGHILPAPSGDPQLTSSPPLLTSRPTLTRIDTSITTTITTTAADAAQRQQSATANVHRDSYVVSPIAFASSSKSRIPPTSTSVPDPLVDITRLRVRSQGHHCLYPGASFQGTQKSGRNSYDVNVTIVDVDFSSSHLCGYLRIRGLTDDWPELTTYFDAEIIGSRYGFLTKNWGATEQEDMVHWARFPAFRHVRHELKKPHLTMKDANRGAVFMRWKEKFLVPDHRVQDINGASFAGFYYVCVDFNPQQSGAPASPSGSPGSPTENVVPSPSSSPVQSEMAAKHEPPPRSRRRSTTSNGRRAGRSSSRALASNVATMSGFYFHQNSEPYQQLSLVHVPEQSSTCFEFR